MTESNDMQKRYFIARNVKNGNLHTANLLTDTIDGSIVWLSWYYETEFEFVEGLFLDYYECRERMQQLIYEREKEKEKQKPKRLQVQARKKFLVSFIRLNNPYVSVKLPPVYAGWRLNLGLFAIEYS